MKIHVLFTLLWLGTESLQDKFSNKKHSKNSKNICDMDVSEVNRIKCFCIKDKYKAVTSAECLLLGVIPNEMYLWDLVLNSQPHLSEFKAVVSELQYMKSIPPKFFKGMLNLKSFSFTFSLMDHVPKNTFGASSSLEEIDLSSNKIVEMDVEAIANLPKLHTVHLNVNRLTSLKSNVFFNLPKLQHLYLNRNNISSIGDKVFTGISTLLELDLSENDICEINKLTFSGLFQLKIIDLSHNKLTGLSSSVFSEMWDVEVSVLLTIYFDSISLLNNIIAY